MAPRTEFFDALAALFEYPGPDVAAVAALAHSLAVDDAPSLVPAVGALDAWIVAHGAEAAEERYTTLFDLKPVCTLHLGYHLFGDTYQRGELLAGLARELRVAGLSAGEDIPDFLPTVLRLIPRIDREAAGDLVDTLVLPALGRMNKALEESSAPWATLLRDLPSFLAPLGHGAPEPDDSFPSNIETTEEALV